MVCHGSILYNSNCWLSVLSPDVCGACRSDPVTTLVALFSRVKRIEHRLHETHSVCMSCSGCTSTEEIECVSLDCAWLFMRKKVEGKLEFISYLQEIICEVEASISRKDSV